MPRPPLDFVASQAPFLPALHILVDELLHVRFTPAMNTQTAQNRPFFDYEGLTGIRHKKLCAKFSI